MPQMADITVKKADGVTNVVFVAKSPSAGDQTPAVWAVDGAHAKPGFRPTAQMRTSSNGPRTARNIRVKCEFPVVEQVSGVDTIVARIPLELTGTLPVNVADTAVQEAFAQMGNLLVSTLVRDAAKAGYAPT